jgi:ACR3 family arsenite transporter
MSAIDSPLPKAGSATQQNINKLTAIKPESSDVEKQDLENAPCCESGARLSTFSSLGFLDRFLAVWIFLAMLIGILLGNFVDDVGPALQKGTFADVSLPIGMPSTSKWQVLHGDANIDTQAIGLLIMMYPILCKVQYEKLHEVFRTREIWVQLGFSIIINWIIAPLIMVRSQLISSVPSRSRD